MADTQRTSFMLRVSPCHALQIQLETHTPFTREQLWDARRHLQQLGLIRFKPWHEGEPDGLYQLLPLVKSRTRKPRRMPVGS